MKSTFISSLAHHAMITSALAMLLAVSLNSRAATCQEDHFVTSQAMQDELTQSAAQRQKNIDAVRKFLSSPIADRAIRDAHYNPEEVRKAIPTLTDDELADLAARSNQVQQEFVAGSLTKTELALIAVAFVVIIVVIVVH
jgi:hypothetical protein